MRDEIIEDSYIYDRVPYPSLSFRASYPDRLAVLALLLGMRPPPVDRCRVLELGCASGGNIVPMAQILPGSEFVGIDLSARQIAEGQEMLSAVGLKNVALRQMNILDVDGDFGQFDYIITHGIYSWVPPVVQEKILEICRRNLTANGVAYVSYNTYPGWHLLLPLREMMFYHTRDVTDPRRRAVESRALLEFLADSEPVGNSPYTQFFKSYVKYTKEHLLPKNDSYLIHDELSEVNEPIYFYQFVERAERHGLRYLAESDFPTMLASNLPPQVAETLRQMAQDTITLEQYMDFLRNRTFRQTLLCHQDVRLSGSPHPDLLLDLYVASSALPVEPEQEVNPGTEPVWKFQANDGATFYTDHPVTKEGMLYLGEVWPRFVPFKELLREARARLNGASSDIVEDAQVLGAGLLNAYGRGDSLVELHTCPPSFVLEVSERPVSSPVARYQARSGIMVTNLRHERVDLTGLSCHLLPCLDGSRDRAALLEIMQRWLEEGTIKLDGDAEEGPVEEAGQVRGKLEEMLETRLQKVARAALLVG